MSDDPRIVPIEILGSVLDLELRVLYSTGDSAFQRYSSQAVWLNVLIAAALSWLVWDIVIHLDAEVRVQCEDTGMSHAAKRGVETGAVFTLTKAF